MKTEQDKDMDKATLDKLIERCTRRDEKAFAEILDQYKHLIAATIQKRIWNLDDVQDQVQIACVKIWRSICDFDPEKGKFSTWICTIANNAATDFLRHRARRDKLLVDYGDQISAFCERHANPILNADETYILESLLEKLCAGKKSDGTRQIFSLLRTGETDRSIAEKLNMPTGTVKAVIRRGKKWLRTVAMQKGLIMAA
ncbi:MAG TPA: RNA polymerase sigma factor [Candidatus Paceibacterota bacterium]